MDSLLQILIGKKKGMGSHHFGFTEKSSDDEPIQSCLGVFQDAIDRLTFLGQSNDHATTYFHLTTHVGEITQNVHLDLCDKRGNYTCVVAKYSCRYKFIW